MSNIKSLLNSMSGRRRIVVLALAACLVLLVYLVLNIPDVDLVLRFSDRLAVLPTAQAEYRQILGRIAIATNDDLLRDETNEEPRIYRGSHGCIAAQGHRAYGTNRPHADILADYAKAFSAMGWKSGDARVETKTTSVGVSFVDPISPDHSSLGKNRYQTIYWVDVVYSDPEIFGCFG